MIPKELINQWRQNAPWPFPDQIEQDLIISRALVAIFSNEFLNENLAFRGGTALHKLYLDPAPRYSEDIDLVQIKSGPIKPILAKIDRVIDFFEEGRTVKQKPNNNTILYRFTSENSETKLKLKIEINCREHFNILELKSFPFKVESRWFKGACEITTYQLEELLGTKLRALYQRKKGRDLFDLYYANQHTEFNVDDVIRCYNEYMNFVVSNPPTARQFELNMKEKQTSDLFTGDMEGLLRPGVEYDQPKAFEWIHEEIVSKL